MSRQFSSSSSSSRRSVGFMSRQFSSSSSSSRRSDNNMEKMKSKLDRLNETERTKEIEIERIDEFGRNMTPMEAYRKLCYKFHGKGPGNKKQEKRMKKFQEDLKTKSMEASDFQMLVVEKMRATLAELKTPYLVLSGDVKPRQTDDPKSGIVFENDHSGSLISVPRDKKVKISFGIKRKPQTGSIGPSPPKKPKN